MTKKAATALIALCLLIESTGLNYLPSVAYADKDVLRPMASASSGSKPYFASATEVAKKMLCPCGVGNNRNDTKNNNTDSIERILA